MSSESTEHPKRLWLVEDDREAGFCVREADVEPVLPERPPCAFARYHLVGKEEWHTVSLELTAYRTKLEALIRAVEWADDMICDWQEKKCALEKQLGEAEDEAAQEEDDDADENENS